MASADLPGWAVIDIGEPEINGDRVHVPMSMRLRVYLKVGPMEAEIGMVDGGDALAVEQLLRDVANEMRRNRLAGE